jgi:hypothetical protein
MDELPENVRKLDLSKKPVVEQRTEALALGAMFTPNIGNIATGLEQWLNCVLHSLERGEDLTLAIAFGEEGPGISFGASLRGPADTLDARVASLESDLRLVLPCVLPGLVLAPSRHAPALEAPFRYQLRPAGRSIAARDLERLDPAPKAGGRKPEAEARGALQLRARPGRRPDLAAVARLIPRPELAGARLTLKLIPFQLNAPHMRAIQEFLRGLSDQLESGQSRLATLFRLDEQTLAHLKQWCITDEGLRLTAELSTPCAVPQLLLDMLCQALYGDNCAAGVASSDLDLSDAWPDRDLTFITRLTAVAAAQERLAARRAGRKLTRRNSLRLGRDLEGEPVAISLTALQQHLYLIGGTGTGKSTLILNLIAQAMSARRGVILFDPHGDLWEAAQRLVPRAREKDLVLLHPADPRGTFTMNLLELQEGEDIETEQARVTGQILDVFKRTLWPNVPEAFGPMFENYYRNAMLLLLNAQGKDASIVDFTRIFSDRGFRHTLLQRCTNRDVGIFWREVAEGASGEPSLSNITPYLVAKLAPIMGNSAFKRILGARASTFDFARIINDGRICLVNLAMREIGTEASRFLGAMLMQRLMDAARSQGRIPEHQRPRAHVFLDEFPGYVSKALAEGLAQVRKFGIDLILANQGLSQIRGDSYQCDVAQEVLNNAANTIAFRVGLGDAAMLSLKLTGMSPQGLATLPNYHAAAQIVREGNVTDPVVIATDPPPKPPRRRRPLVNARASDDSELRAARTRILAALRQIPRA